MAQVIVRKLEDRVVAALKRRAAAKGRRLEQELREILRDAAKPQSIDLVAEFDRIRAMTPAGPPIDTTRMIREDRDSR